MDWLRKDFVGWRHVQNLGPRLVNLRIHADLLYGNGYQRALEQCSNLRELYISGDFDVEGPELTDEMIAYVFSPSRFPKLEYLGIEQFKMNKRNMRLIASCTKNLVCASFACFESDSEVSAFELIADSNSHLKNITIGPYVPREEDESAEATLESLRGLVKMFRKCRTLWFDIPCSNEKEVKVEDVNHILKVLPCREVDIAVWIGEAQYGYGK